MSMDLWQLTVFSRVVELQGFSKAAEAIHLSQPTVSNHIKELEKHFDCILIDRVDKKAVPTKEGEILYRYAKRLLKLRDEAEASIAEYHGKHHGHLTIAASTIPGGYLLPRVIGGFRKQYPQITITMLVGDTGKVVGDILEGSVELGIVGAVSTNKKIDQEPLVEDRMDLIIPGNHRWRNRKSIQVEELVEEPFLIREKGSGTLKSMQQSLEHLGIKLHQLEIVAELGSTAAVIQAIKSNVGVSILSPISVVDELKGGVLKALAIDSLDLRRSFYLTTHKDRTVSSLCKAFIQYVRDCDLSALLTERATIPE